MLYTFEQIRVFSAKSQGMPNRDAPHTPLPLETSTIPGKTRAGGNLRVAHHRFPAILKPAAKPLF